MEQLRIDLVPMGVTPNAHASQYDVGRVIRFLLYNGGSVYTLAGTETITVKMAKPDGTEETVSVTNTSSNYVDFVTTDGLLNQAGLYPCEISITSGTDVIGSKNFNLRVELDPYDGAGVVTVTVGPADICTFTTNVVDLLQEVKCNINPVQDLHGEDKPYPAGGGVNVWDEEWEVGGIDDITGNNYVKADRIRSKNYNAVNESDTYYLSMPNYGTWVYCYDENKAYISSRILVYANRTFTLLPNTKYIRLEVFSEYGTTYNNDISINNPSTDHDYHPYENVCPIEGYTEMDIIRSGVNLWDEEIEEGRLNPFDGTEVIANDYYRSKNFIPCKSGVSYYAVTINNPPTFVIVFYDKNQDYLGYLPTASVRNTVFSIPDGASFLKLYYTKGDYSISINYPATDTTYHPYTGNTYTISFGQTVYGGVLDVTRGKLHVTRLYKIYDGSEAWYTSGASGGEYCVSLVEVLDNVKYPTTNDEVLSCSCNMLVGKTANQTYARNQGISYQEGNGLRIYANDYNTSNITPWKTLLSNTPLQVVYELATPFDIDLTPEFISSVVGTNNVFADCGETEVKYLKAEG